MGPVQINELFDHDPIDLIDQQILILDGIRFEQINDQDLEFIISKYIELPAIEFLRESKYKSREKNLTTWLQTYRPQYYKNHIIGSVKNSTLYESREIFNLWEIPDENKSGNKFEVGYWKALQQWYIFFYETLTRLEIEFVFEMNHFVRQSDKNPNKEMYDQLCNMINRFQTDIEMRDPIITPIEHEEMREVIRVFWEEHTYFIHPKSLAYTIGGILIDHKVYLDRSNPEWKKETRNPPPEMIEAFEKDDLLKEWAIYWGIIESEKAPTITPADPLAMAAIEPPKKTITIDENQNDFTVKQWAIIYLYLDTGETLEGKTQWKKLDYMVKNYHVQKSLHTIYKEIPKVRIQIRDEDPKILKHLEKVAAFLKLWSHQGWKYLKEDIETIKESSRKD